MPDIVAASEPELANQMIEKILAGEAPSAPESGVAFTDLPDTYVSLPGGYLTPDGDLVREAEVRELTGFDEEALARAGTSAKIMHTLLQRGVVKVGDTKPDQHLLNSLLAGDRDTLLLAIRKATYGSELELPVICPECREAVKVKVDLNKDVEVKALDDAADRQFTVGLNKGREAVVHLPDGAAQRAILQAEDKTIAELNTLLLKNCVESIDDMPVISDDSVRRLSIRDREAITDEITKRNPGPLLSAVKKACPSCEEDINLPLSLAGLFRL